MSILFVNERKQPVSSPSPVDLEAALVALTNREASTMVSAIGGISVERVAQLERECRQIEQALIEAIDTGKIRTKAESVQFVKDATADNKDFPAERLIQQMIDHCKPATFAQMVIDAKDEAKPTAAVVGEIL